MKKKIKERNILEEQKKKIEFELNLKNSVKRGIAIVLLFLMTILFSFGFFGIGGAFGEFLDKISGIVFGWGKWLFPLVLFLAMVILLFKKKTVFYVVKIIGLSLVFLSLLGFFHIFYDQSVSLEMAKIGQGGGYVGYLIGITLVKLIGKIAGIIALFSFFTIGIMVAFNFSIVEFFVNLLKKKELPVQKDAEVENISIEDNLEQKNETEIKTREKSEELKKEDLDCNIKEIKFVEDANFSQMKEDTQEIDEEIEKGEEEEEFNIKKISFGNKNMPKRAENIPENISKEWKLPSLNLLDDQEGQADGGNIDERVEIIKDAFANFGIELEFSGHKIGPSVTQYSFRPAVGVKLSKIMTFGDDLALALAAHPIRIEAPIPGKSLIGIEVPNSKPVKVRLREALESKEFKESKVKSKLMMPLGKNVEGTFVSADLGGMPHLLIAGTTGTGKSVCINSIILSLLFQNSPEDLKMILVDPKRVELSLYDKIPHLISEVITDNKKVINALRWAVREMEERYKILQSVGSRDIESYDEKRERGEMRKHSDPDTGEIREERLNKLPAIVIVIDELADLMLSYGKEVEGAIMRLAQMARAVGIHLIISTQRPSVNIITGIIKANITNRIALHVNNQIDSRTIIDMRGAENLLGKGDLLFISNNSPKPVRLQNSFVSENEVKRVVEYIREQGERLYKNKDNELKDELKENLEVSETVDNGGNFEQVDFSINQSEEDDSLYEDVKSFVFETKKASASLLQRRFRIGYNRAARLLDYLERDGIVGPADGAKSREILVDFGGKKNKSDTDKEVNQEERDKWQV